MAVILLEIFYPRRSDLFVVHFKFGTHAQWGLSVSDDTCYPKVSVTIY